MNRDLYFIALIPPSPLKEKIQRLKMYMSEEYGSAHALKSPPHVTLLAPFSLKKHYEEELDSLLKDFVKGRPEFIVKLRDFGVFPPRVLYIEVVPIKELMNTQAELESLARSNHEVFNYNYQERPFHPHITLAFKDFRKKEFYRAWEEFNTKKFSSSFIARELSLLKHDGGKWTISKEYPLATS